MGSVNISRLDRTTNSFLDYPVTTAKVVSSYSRSLTFYPSAERTIFVLCQKRAVGLPGNPDKVLLIVVFVGIAAIIC